MGDQTTTLRRKTDRRCTLDGCDGKHKALGYCALHYERWKRLGSTELLSPEARALRRFNAALRRFKGQYVTTIDGCWLWQGTVRPDGYGQIAVGGKLHLAHKWRYEQEHGPVPEGLELDHLCRNKACVRPAHLEAVTHRENILRRFRLTAAEHRAIQGRRVELQEAA